jgi:hypothetical protein
MSRACVQIAAGPETQKALSDPGRSVHGFCDLQQGYRGGRPGQTGSTARSPLCLQDPSFRQPLKNLRQVGRRDIRASRDILDKPGAAIAANQTGEAANCVSNTLGQRKHSFSFRKIRTDTSINGQGGPLIIEPSFRIRSANVINRPHPALVQAHSAHSNRSGRRVGRGPGNGPSVFAMRSSAP